MVSISSTSGTHPVQLPTSPVQTPATNSSAQPLPGAFPADSVPQVARGMPSKVCIGNLSFRVGVIKATLRSDERGSVQAALNNIVPGQTPELDENRTFSYQAYSDPQKNPGQMSVSGEVDNQNNLLSLTAMHVHPDMLSATTERPVFESVRFAPPLLLKFSDVRMVKFDHTEDNVGALSFRELDSTRSSEPLSKIIQHLLPCRYQAGEKLADDFHIVTFMTAHNEEMKIVGKSKEGNFLATDPKTGKILAQLKRIAVYSSDQAQQAGEAPSIAWIEPQNAGLNGGAKTYSALYHETQAEHLNNINTDGIYPRNTTGTEGIGLMNSEDGVYLYAYHKTQQPGNGVPVALFANNTKEWNLDPCSPGLRAQTPTVPARNYKSGKAAISVTAPLTPRTVQGMDYFHSLATGTTKPAGQGAQELLNEFHRKFPGTGFPTTIS